MTKRDYYEVLGVSRTASQDDIKRAFKQLARKHHPDVNPGDKAAEEKFKEINEAFQVLNDPEKKSQYDQFGHAAFKPEDLAGFRSFSFEDLFRNFGFGEIFTGFGRETRAREGADFRYDIERVGINRLRNFYANANMGIIPAPKISDHQQLRA